jgi:TonB family protein
MLNCRHQSVFGAPTDAGSVTAFAPALKLELTRRPHIAAAGSVGIHAVLVLALILASTYAVPAPVLDKTKSLIGTILVAPPPAPLQRQTQNQSADTLRQVPAASTAAPPEAVQIPPSRIAIGEFDRSFHDDSPPAVSRGVVVIGALDGGARGDALPGPRVFVGLVGGWDGPMSSQSGTGVEPQLLSVPTPVYTEEAKRLNVTGAVVLIVKVAKTGSVHFVKIVSGLGHGLDESAIAAVNEGRCRPATESGVPVDAIGTITVTFRLS